MVFWSAYTCTVLYSNIKRKKSKNKTDVRHIDGQSLLKVACAIQINDNTERERETKRTSIITPNYRDQVQFT